MINDLLTKSTDALIGQHMADRLDQHGLLTSIVQQSETLPDIASSKYASVIRTYIPDYQHEDDKLRVTIIPATFTQSRWARNTWKENYGIDTVVHQRIEVIDTDDGKYNITKSGDFVTRVAQQVQRFFECPSEGGAKIDNDPCTDCLCAVWLNCIRSVIYNIAEVPDMHLVVTTIRHNWLFYRPLCCCPHS